MRGLFRRYLEIGGVVRLKAVLDDEKRPHSLYLIGSLTRRFRATRSDFTRRVPMWSIEEARSRIEAAPLTDGAASDRPTRSRP